MQTDILIIGQGLSGTFLHWYLERAGLHAFVIDEWRPQSASRAAAGVINPVTGRRMVKTWMIDELIPFAGEAYGELGRIFGKQLIFERSTIDFFPTPQMRLAYEDRHREDLGYLGDPRQDSVWSDRFIYDFGYGEISPCYLIDLPALLSSYRNRLQAQQKLSEEKFCLEDLSFPSSGIRYRDINARKIIFCDGIESAANPLFINLPFAPNKGEALLVEIKDLDDTHLYKKGISIVPFAGDHFWVGSSYEWEFSHDRPTEAFRHKTEAKLKSMLRVPYSVIDHIASIRPATLERRPFAGFHPVHPNAGLLNGMGTKGCALAPYFASQMVENLTHDVPIRPDADIRRFGQLLNRPAGS